MNEFHVFVQDLRRQAGVEGALRRLNDDFGVDESLVVAAAWLGSRGVPPDPAFAASLETSFSAQAGSECADARFEGEEECRFSLQDLCEALALPDSPDTTETIAGWFLLVAPCGATCTEQSRWLETIREACIQAKL